MCILTSTSSGGSYSSMSNMFKYVKQSSKFMMEGVKSLVVGHRKLPVTRTVDCLSELKQTPETDSFLALDPKIYRKTDNLLPALKNTFNDVSMSDVLCMSFIALTLFLTI